MRMPCFGDFEASGLALQSYPIEVAWSLPDGTIYSRLVQTHETWGRYWDPAAEDLHCISQERLSAEGLPAIEVAEEMNRDLDGETLYFDGGDYDRCWLGQLYMAAGLRPTFRFGNFDTLLAAAGVVESTKRDAAEALARQDLGDLPLHQAAHDVKLLQRWFVRARGGMRG